MNLPLETIAAIPLLDWDGPRFLLFYLTALIVLAMWCRSRVRSSLHRYEDDRHQAAMPTDPFEAAYLASGPGRVAQLAVARLLHRGLVHWKSGMFGSKLIVRAEQVPADVSEAERGLLERIIAMNEKGLPVNEAGRWVYPSLRAIEVRLASQGLRPTHEERSGRRIISVMPLIGLALLGIIKVFLGIGRDKPVWFLVALLVITLVLIIFFASSVPRLTRTGEHLLEKMRLRNETSRHGAQQGDLAELGMFSHSVALFGPIAVAALPCFAPIHGELEKLHAKASAASAGGCSSGCGGITGCGSSGGDGGGGGGSGCGGGCGGCGGGGD